MVVTVVSAALSIVFAICAIGNVVALIDQLLRKRNNSLVAVIGGLSGAAACLIAPVDGLSRYWWVPLIADIGTLPLLTWTAIFLALRGRCRSLAALDDQPVRMSLDDGGTALVNSRGAAIPVPDGWISASVISERLDQRKSHLRAFFRVLAGTFGSEFFRVRIGPPLYRVPAFAGAPADWRVLHAPSRESGAEYELTGHRIESFVDFFDASLSYEYCSLLLVDGAANREPGAISHVIPICDEFQFFPSASRMVIWMDGDSGSFDCFMRRTDEADRFISDLRSAGFEIGEMDSGPQQTGLI